MLGALRLDYGSDWSKMCGALDDHDRVRSRLRQSLRPSALDYSVMVACYRTIGGIASYTDGRSGLAVSTMRDVKDRTRTSTQLNLAIRNH